MEFSRENKDKPLTFSFWVSEVTESRSVVSNSLWPHGLYSPWNSLGQNTGVGSLSLLQRIFPTQGLNFTQVSCIAGGFFTNWAIRIMSWFSSILQRWSVSFFLSIFMDSWVLTYLIYFNSLWFLASLVLRWLSLATVMFKWLLRNLTQAQQSLITSLQSGMSDIQIPFVCCLPSDLEHAFSQNSLAAFTGKSYSLATRGAYC